MLRRRDDDDDDMGIDIDYDDSVTPSPGSPLSGSTIQARVAADDLADVRQALDSSGCYSVTDTREIGGGVEIVVRAVCPDDAAEGLLRFMVETWKWRGDAPQVGPPRGAPLPREEVKLRRLEAAAERHSPDAIGNMLVNPPVEFGPVSRKLAGDIRLILDSWDSIQKLLVGSWLLALMTSNPLELAATGGYDPTNLVNALGDIPVITRAMIRQRITLELITQPPSLSYREREYWNALRDALL